MASGRLSEACSNGPTTITAAPLTTRCGAHGWYGVPQVFPKEVLEEARGMLEAPPPDPDRSFRRDLTHLKVYAIDSEDTMEVRARASGLPGGRRSGWNMGERVASRGVRGGVMPPLRSRRNIGDAPPAAISLGPSVGLMPPPGRRWAPSNPVHLPASADLVARAGSCALRVTEPS